MGSAAAWQLARRGRRVLAIDRFHPPHAEGSSHGGSRVIREMAFEHPRYVPLVRRAYELWAELDPKGSAELLIPSGALYLGPDSSSVVAGSRASARQHGVPSEELDAAAIRDRWPAFRVPEGSVGLFERRAGVLRPERCIQAMLDAAAGGGVALAFGESMSSWQPAGDGVRVITDQRTLEAGTLVLATGPWMLEELRSLGVEAWVERVVQHWFVPSEPALFGPARFPIYLWEDEAGIIFYGFPMVDGVLKCAIHHRGESASMETLRRDVAAGEIAAARERLAALLPAGTGTYHRSAVCIYTNTPDGDFIIDRHPRSDRVILASPCSGIGFKFAPLVGEIIADLVTEGASRWDLEPFCLRRFLKAREE